ncbi:MAG: YtxH domain-containing protein [Acidobacteria bacterium]|nr:MAG: YtxH domain-containing protein [Acidobacteriota bacterium]
MAANDSGGSVLAGFLLGTIVGVAIGLLTAPKPGRETREDLARWADSAREKARERLGDLQERAERVRHVAAEKGEKVKELAGEAGQKVRHAVSAVRERLTAPREEGSADA